MQELMRQLLDCMCGTCRSFFLGGALIQGLGDVVTVSVVLAASLPLADANERIEREPFLLALTWPNGNV